MALDMQQLAETFNMNGLQQFHDKMHSNLHQGSL